MEDKYTRAEIEFRKYIESLGRVRWASPRDTKLLVPYWKLIEVFGENLEKDEKDKLLDAMVRNSGYSSTIVFPDGCPPPCTYFGVMEEDEEKFEVAACLYRPRGNPWIPYHEGTHFLARHGPKERRIIKEDIPLAEAMYSFFRLMEDDKYAKRMSKSFPEERALIEALNPFHFRIEAEEEHLKDGMGWNTDMEAQIVGLKAYYMARKARDERAGIKFLRCLMNLDDLEYVSMDDLRRVGFEY
jgi:hypothetical protein